MAKKMNLSQFRQAVNKYNNAVKKYNETVKKNIDQYNRQVNRHNNEVKKSINTYNREVRKFNTEQERRRQKLNQSIRAFNNSKITTTISTNVVYRQYVERLNRSYDNLYSDPEADSWQTQQYSNIFEDYPTQEVDNSIRLYNSLNGIDDGSEIPGVNLQESYIEQGLNNVSFDLGKRWRGALYSLSPENPDAARHFCTSVREVFIQILEKKAPDQQVLSYFPGCEMHEGRPSRRAKIRYVLCLKNIDSGSLENFVDTDIDDILALFRSLNDGTHGSAGKFTILQLTHLKKRAEDLIQFLIEL